MPSQNLPWMKVSKKLNCLWMNFLQRSEKKESLSSDILFSQLVCRILFHVILSHGHPRGDLKWNGDYACPLITGFETVTAKTGITKFVLLYFFSPLKKYSKDATT